MNERGATLIIDRFDLRLPRGFEHRGDAIARAALRLLAQRNVELRGTLARLDVSGISVRGGETNGVIARRICRAIEHRIAADAQSSGVQAEVTHVD